MPCFGRGDALVLPEANAFSGRALGVWSAYQRRNNFFRRWYKLNTPAQWQRDKLKTRPATKAPAHKTMAQWRDMLRLTALIIGLIAPAAGVAPPVASVPSGVAPAVQMQAARLAVAQGGGRWILGWQTHDAALVAALFAGDGMELGRGGVVTRGRRAIGARFGRLFGAIGPVQASRQTVDLWLMGSTVTESGRYTYVFSPGRPGQKPNVSAGTYVTVWQKQKNGQWLIHSDVSVAAR